MSEYLDRTLRAETLVAMERSLLNVDLDDTARLERIRAVAEQFQVLASFAAARMEEIETRENAEEFAELLADAIADVLNPAVETAQRIAREREEEAENDARNRLTPACPATGWERGV